MDITALTGSRPEGRRNHQIVSGRVSLTHTAPASFTSPMVVDLPPDVSVTFTYWPKLHGSTLPTQGVPVVVVYDQQGVPHLIGWDAANS